MITVHLAFCNIYGQQYATYFTEEHKLLPIIVPIKDTKHNRLFFLEENTDRGYINNIKPFESIEDTLLDMANYCILAAISFNEHKETIETDYLKNIKSIYYDNNTQ